MTDDTYVASSVIIGGAQLLGSSQRGLPGSMEIHLEGLELKPPAAKATSAEEMVESHLAAFVDKCRDRRRFPLELFFALEAWASYLGSSARHQERIALLSSAFQLGIEKHPSAALDFTVLLARSYLEVGEARNALNLLLPYITRPYRAATRSGLEGVLHTAGQAALAIPEMDGFTKAAWFLLQSFSTDITLKIGAAGQLRKFYRGTIGLLSARNKEATLSAKVIACLTLFVKLCQNSILTRWLARPSRFCIIALLYQHNYWRSNWIRRLPHPDCASPATELSRTNGTKTRILITRAMGGVGDLLMMTPGIGATKARNPDREIHLAIPREFFPIFQGNEDVVVKDIENDVFEPRDYSAWYNLSDCPASRIEARTSPRVKKNRIDIFASAIGVSPKELDRFGRTPRYFVSAEESRFAEEFLSRNGLSDKTLIGVHPYTADTYRDFPHFEGLVKLLARDYPVLVFHSARLEGYDFPNAMKIDRYPLRQSVALLQRCSVLVAPDSSLMHVAAALGLPTLAIFGPTDGRVRTRDYRSVEVLDLSNVMRCIPCWRHEYQPCLVSGNRTSVCIHSIDVPQVYQRVLAKVGERARPSQASDDRSNSCSKKTSTKA